MSKKFASMAEMAVQELLEQPEYRESWLKEILESSEVETTDENVEQLHEIITEVTEKLSNNIQFITLLGKITKEVAS